VLAETCPLGYSILDSNKGSCDDLVSCALAIGIDSSFKQIITVAFELVYPRLGRNWCLERAISSASTWSLGISAETVPEVTISMVKQERFVSEPPCITLYLDKPLLLSLERGRDRRHHMPCLPRRASHYGVHPMWPLYLRGLLHQAYPFGARKGRDGQVPDLPSIRHGLSTSAMHQTLTL
jgi:hypothetical protein